MCHIAISYGLHFSLFLSAVVARGKVQKLLCFVSITMSSISQLLQQVQACNAYLASQAGLLSPDTAAQTMVGMARSLMSQIQRMRIDGTAAAALNGAIAASSFDGELKSQIATTIATCAMETLANQSCQVSTRTQTLDHPWNFTSAADVHGLSDTAKGCGQKVCILADRFRLLGISRPSEQTCGRLTALSAAYIWPDADPAPQQLHALLLDIKNALKTCSVPPGTQYLAKYPTNASELPQNIASQAYTEADRVLPNEPPRLSEMLRKVVLRTSNKSLARDARASSSGQQPNAVEALLQLMQGMQRVNHTPNRRANIQLLDRSGSYIMDSDTTGGSQLAGLLSARSTNLFPAFADGTGSSQLAGLCARSINSFPAIADGSIDNQRSPQESSQQGVIGFAPAQMASQFPLSTNQRCDDHDATATVADMERAAAAINGPEIKKRVIMKRPAAAGVVAESSEHRCDSASSGSEDETSSEIPAPKKRPSASAPSMKRPAAASKVGRPPMPKLTMGTTVVYKNGKINVSLPKLGFRVFRNRADRVDKLVKWSWCDSKADAWERALDMIDGKC